MSSTIKYDRLGNRPNKDSSPCFWKESTITKADMALEYLNRMHFSEEDTLNWSNRHRNTDGMSDWFFERLGTFLYIDKTLYIEKFHWLISNNNPKNTQELRALIEKNMEKYIKTVFDGLRQRKKYLNMTDAEIREKFWKGMPSVELMVDQFRERHLHNFIEAINTVLINENMTVYISDRYRSLFPKQIIKSEKVKFCKGGDKQCKICKENKVHMYRLM